MLLSAGLVFTLYTQAYSNLDHNDSNSFTAANSNPKGTNYCKEQ